MGKSKAKSKHETARAGTNEGAGSIENGGRVRSVFSKPVLILATLAALLSLSLEYLPSPIAPQPLDFQYENSTRVQQTRYQEGVGKEINSSVFDHAEKVLQHQALAAEDMAVSPDGEYAFMGLKDGRLVYMASSDAQPTLHAFARTGKELAGGVCGQLVNEPVCGRPLGLAFVLAAPFAHYTARLPSRTDGVTPVFPSTHILLVADAYKGLLLYNGYGDQTVVFDGINGHPFRFLNSMAVTPEGDVYLTDSSRRFHRNQVVLDMLERSPTGRLLHFNPRTQTRTVLASNLGFPNGIVLVDNDTALLVALTFQHKLIKYTIQTKTIQDFAFLPGPPDNLWLRPLDNTLFIGLVSIPPPWITYCLESIKIRKVLATTVVSPWIVAAMGRYGVFVTVDAVTGDVAQVFQDRNGIAKLTSGVHAWGDHLYLLSWYRDYLVRLPKSMLD